MTIRIISTLTLCTLLSAFTTATLANPKTGTLSGQVRDSHGKPIVGTQVRIVETGEVARTDSSGNYAFVGEGAGTYSIQAWTPTYQNAVSSVIIKIDATSTLNFSLNRRKLGPNERHVSGGIIVQPGEIRSYPLDPFANLPQETFQGDLGLHSTARSR